MPLQCKNYMKKNKKHSAENKTKKNVLKQIMTLLLCIMILAVLGIAALAAANLVVIKSANDYIISADEASSLDADCIIVLGCKADGDKPSLMLEHRLMTGIELFRKGASDRLLMSGDHGRSNYDEVYAMKKYALERGIDTDSIFCDHAGFSTYESMYRAKEIFGCKKLVVVTQKFHLSRAIYIGRKLGIEVYGVACDRGAYLTAGANDRREALARPKAILDCILKPKPKYLGDVIPISGKGSETDDKTFE